MSILQRESNEGSKEKHGPTLGVCFTVLSAKRQSTVCSFLIQLHFKEDEVSVSRFTGIVWTESQFVQQNVRFQKKNVSKTGLK